MVEEKKEWITPVLARLLRADDTGLSILATCKGSNLSVDPGNGYGGCATFIGGACREWCKSDWSS